VTSPFERVSFQCPHCGSEAKYTTLGVTCLGCGTLFPFRNGSIDFMGPYLQVPATSPDAVQDVVRSIVSAYGLPELSSGKVKAAVLASLERTGVSYIDAEIAALPNRFGHPGFNDVSELATQSAGGVGITILSDFCPPRAPVGAEVYRSIRIRAEEALERSSATLSYRWERVAPGMLGRLKRLLGPKEQQGQATAPIALSRGRELSLPVHLQTPDEPGRWSLILTAMKDGVATSSHRVEVDIVEDQPSDHLSGQAYPDYGSDHQAGLRMLLEYLEARDRCLLLEVASGVHPHLARLAELGHTVIGSDVCSNMMQLGSIFYGELNPSILENLGYASFDAMNAPFSEKQFDGVTLFSALHHFPDPSGFLSALGKLVKPGGFVAALCEPADPSSTLGTPEYIRDLELGINEQVFAPEEYLWMFQQAGLRIAEIRNDAGSIKIIGEISQIMP
jgi:ubiquinone/menaquinone biosynthesis C-methylase UbiE